MTDPTADFTTWFGPPEILADDWYRITRYPVRDGPPSRHARRPAVACRRGDRVAVLPYSRRRDTVVLVRQFRLPAALTGVPGGLVLEACGGLLDGSSPQDAARRELSEETGYDIPRLDLVRVCHLSPGLIAERTWLFVADLDRGHRVHPGGGVPGEGEHVEVLELPLALALDMTAEGKITDAKTLLLLTHLPLPRPTDATSVGPTDRHP